jgi:hypothetical protein
MSRLGAVPFLPPGLRPLPACPRPRRTDEVAKVDSLPKNGKSLPFMADDIFYGSSMAALKKQIKEIAERDQRSLPSKAKVFAAVAKLQKFDLLPDVARPDELTALAANGCVELQRGISSSSGVSAKIYAAELLRGTLFPGTMTAFGQGIYLSTPSCRYEGHSAFPHFSRVAHKYAKKCPPGIIVRCVLKKDANVQDSDDLMQYLRENKNRAKEVFDAPDLGTFAAALGIDGYHCSSLEHCDETTWVILNRTALIFQPTVLQVSPDTPNLPA